VFFPLEENPRHDLAGSGAVASPADRTGEAVPSTSAGSPGTRPDIGESSPTVSLVEIENLSLQAEFEQLRNQLRELETRLFPREPVVSPGAREAVVTDLERRLMQLEDELKSNPILERRQK
jgi:hypothetical protein